MKNFFRNVYSVLNVLLVLAILAQFLFIGVVMFTIAQAPDTVKGVNDAINGDDVTNFSNLHAANGMMVVPLIILLLVIASFAARHSWKTTGWTALLIPLIVIQIILPFFSFGAVFPNAYLVSALHPVNATILLGLSVYLLFTRWAFGKHGQKMQAGAKA
jgi:hypothetical protein